MGFVNGSDGLSVAPLLGPKKMRQTTRRVLSAEYFCLEHLLYSFHFEESVVDFDLTFAFVWKEKPKKNVCKDRIIFKQFQQ
jgi:hypothetical protein